MKLFNSLTEDERDFIVSHKNVSIIKEAQNDFECGNYNENLDKNISCKQIIKKNSIVFVSKFANIDCCSIDCCDDIFRSSMD